MNDFFKTIRSFLTEFLSEQKCYSPNTIKSYKDGLNIFVDYLRNERNLKVSEINFQLIDRQLILDYLHWIEHSRQCSIASRNQRLMSLRSFFKYAGMLDCTLIALQLEVENIPAKATKGRMIEFLSDDALQALLQQPDIKKKTGLRNQFFMILMYDTAGRCSEILNIRVKDLKLNTTYPTIYLTGKGNKTRSVPLLSKTVEHCKRYLLEFHSDAEYNNEKYLFYTTIHGIQNPMSADNVAAFMKKYGEAARQSCPEVPERVHPHQLRHTRSIQFYRGGMPLALLSEYLGHADTETTKIYAYADTEMKRAAMEKAEYLRKGTPAPSPIWENDEELILKLSGLK